MILAAAAHFLGILAGSLILVVAGERPCIRLPGCFSPAGSELLASERTSSSCGRAFPSYSPPMYALLLLLRGNLLLS
jgi:hypothetical protein